MVIQIGIPSTACLHVQQQRWTFQKFRDKKDAVS